MKIPRLAAIAVLLACGLAHAQVTISRLTVQTADGKASLMVKSGTEVWAQGLVRNEGAAQSVSWFLLLDGQQVSFGGWTVPSGKHALFTTIDSSSLSKGAHLLDLSVFVGSTLVARETATVIAK